MCYDRLIYLLEGSTSKGRRANDLEEKFPESRKRSLSTEYRWAGMERLLSGYTTVDPSYDTMHNNIISISGYISLLDIIKVRHGKLRMLL
jgi:hypothetical protein